MSFNKVGYKYAVCQAGRGGLFGIDPHNQEPERHFPNECFVCKSKAKVCFCKRCNMVAYCGPQHQLQHLSTHKSLCKAISSIMKEKNISFLYEGLRNCELLDWIEGKIQISKEVQQKLARPLHPDEEKLFKYPRVCAICHESDSAKLRFCPGCTAVSFCLIHPFSTIHDRACGILKHHLPTLIKKEKFEDNMTRYLIESIGTKSLIIKSEDPPISSADFFERFVKLKIPLTTEQKVYMSDYYSLILTLFSALKSTEGSITTETIIFIDEKDTIASVSLGRYWETLLHLLPEIKILKIIYLDGPTNMRTEIPICKVCRSKKKRLYAETLMTSLEVYLNQEDSLVPSLCCFFNVKCLVKMEDDKKLYTELVERWSNITCPMLFTTFIEPALLVMHSCLLASPKPFHIMYQGYNDFRPSVYLDELHDGNISQSSQFIILFKRKGIKPIPKFEVNSPYPYFYASACHVCRAIDPKVACEMCNLIFYCSRKHRDEHRLYHAEICKIVASLLKEMRIQNLYEIFKNSVPELWIKARIKFMMKVQTRLGRQLTEFEEQMIFFPRACIICHETNANLLSSCECRIYTCKEHKSHPFHKQICQESKLAFHLPSGANIPTFVQHLMYSTEIIKTATTMQEFIDLQGQLMNIPKSTNILDDLVVSNFLTMPLTLIYMINEFNLLDNSSSLVVHILGATIVDLIPEMWRTLLIILHQLQNLQIVFVGTYLAYDTERSIDTSELPEIKDKTLTFVTISSNYDYYLQSEAFVQPNVVMSPNMHLHVEKEAGVYLISWKESIFACKEAGIPFILTAGMKEFANKDHELICEFVGTRENSHFYEENPFASMAPRRDFQTEGMIYANKSVYFYDWKSATASNVNQEQEPIEETLENTSFFEKEPLVDNLE